MLSFPSFGRALVLSLAFAPAAFAQVAPSPFIDKDAATTYEADVLVQDPSIEIDAAVTDAMRASSAAMAEEPTPEAMQDAIRDLEAAIAAGEMTEEEAIAELEGTLEGMANSLAEAMGAMFGLTPEMMEAAEVTSRSGTVASSGPRLVGKTDRSVRRVSVQSYPVISDGYGMDGDGFPDRMAISGTIVDAGSLRICRFDAPPVSRWLRIRLSDTTATYPGEQIVVAVQCHEDKKELLIGRRVRLEVWKSIIGRPIRMATDDVPSVGTPMYESYPGNVRLGG